MFVIYIAITVVAFIFYVKWRQTYWQRKGVPYLEPDFFFGNMKQSVTIKISPGELNKLFYERLQKLSTKFAGIYFFWQPLFVPLDPALIKRILTKDFSFFGGHGIYHHPKDILTMNLFNLEGEKWKELRAKLTPTFTTGKMKMMFENILEKTEGLEKLVENYSANHEPFVIKEVLGRFTTDIIASCAFGIDCNSLEEPDNIFRKYGKKVLAPPRARFWLIGTIPWKLLGHLGYKNNGHEVTNFFTNIVKETIKSREVNETFRKDFMHFLLQLKNHGALSDTTKVNGEFNTKGKELLSEDEIIAQCFSFFLGGFETPSTTMTFAFLELATNPDIQEKVRQEINEVLAKYEGKITYDAVMEMPYLEKVIQETLRKYPPVTDLPRVCTKTYKIPDTDVLIEKGTRVQIPVWGMQMDPQYFPNPDVFDPERFSEKNKAKRSDFVYLPFGEGPRMCLGLRFGMLQSKVGLVALLRKFRFTIDEKTPLPIQMAESSLIITIKGDLWLNATRI